MTTSLTDAELLEKVRACYSQDELHRIWREYSDRIIADPQINETYNTQSMSLDGP